MDQNVDQIYHLLAGENYPVTLEDLKNPTSECMVKIMVTFLSELSIDGKIVQRATFGQEQSLSYPEAHQEVISLINLHEVMLKLSNRIFVKDLYLTDITSPGAKKARRLIWTLLNFILYAKNKLDELIGPLETIFSRLNTQNDLAAKKKEVMELRKEVVLENSKKTALKEKHFKQIEEAEKRVEQINKETVVLEEQAQIAKQTKQQAQRKNGTVKQQVVKMNEKIVEMERTVVKSPEEYQTRLGNFGQDCSEKQEKLQGMIDRLRTKQELQSQFEKIYDFVNQEYQKFSKVQDEHLKSKTLAKIKADKSRELDELQAVIQILHESFANSDEKTECESGKVDEINAQCQEHIAPLLKVHMTYLSKTQDVKKRLEGAEIRCHQLRCEKGQLSKRITSLDEEITELLKDCQKQYTNDIVKQVEIEKLWKNKYNMD